MAKTIESLPISCFQWKKNVIASLFGLTSDEWDRGKDRLKHEFINGGWTIEEIRVKTHHSDIKTISVCYRSEAFLLEHLHSSKLKLELETA